MPSVEEASLTEEERANTHRVNGYTCRRHGGDVFDFGAQLDEQAIDLAWRLNAERGDNESIEVLVPAHGSKVDIASGDDVRCLACHHGDSEQIVVYTVDRDRELVGEMEEVNDPEDCGPDAAVVTRSTPT